MKQTTRRAKSKASPPARRVRALQLPTIHPDVAGADIGAREITVCVPADRAEQNVRTFATFTACLEELVRWLQQCRVTSVAMESTGNYWLPLYQLLCDAGIEAVLVNTRQVRTLPGRKSDVLDCQWLQHLHAVGLVRGSFRPPQEICALRSLVRLRETLVQQAGDQVRHMQNACDQMNLHLHHVISDLVGLTGQSIVRAILEGQRDPVQLAQLCDRRIKASAHEIARSLQGDWREEHLLALRLGQESWAHLQAQLARLEEQITRWIERLGSQLQMQPLAAAAQTPRVAPAVTKAPVRRVSRYARVQAQNEHLRAQFERVLGVDLTAVPGLSVLTVQTFLSEVGPDLSAFADAAHFSSWLGLCPGTKISGGRVLDRRTRPGKGRLALGLRQASLTLHRNKSVLGQRYRRLRTRLGAPKALTATAHQLARIIFTMVKTKSPYDESIFAEQERRHAQRSHRRFLAEAKARGFQLSPLT